MRRKQLIAGLTVLIAAGTIAATAWLWTQRPPSKASNASKVPTEPATPNGKWRPARPTNPAPSPGSGKEAAAQVQAVPYLGGYRAPSELYGVVKFDRDRTFPGLNLYTSGHAPEAILMTLDGRELQRWHRSIAEVWPDLAADPEIMKTDFWRRAWLYPNGDLLAIFDGHGLIKLDRSSRVLWADRGGYHHDLQVAENGSIFVLDREGKLIPRIHPTLGVLEDFITVLAPNGRRKAHISLLEAFENSPYASLLKGMPDHGDIFHTNTLEILDGRLASRIPAFKAGNILISVLQISTLAVVDPETRQVVWALQGPWRKQHQPTVLDNGHLLLFDNVGLDRERSRVLELDPTSGAIVWQYGGSAAQELSSHTLGTAQRLGNGNTLITESENGRAIEVTPSGEIVWEFRSPYRAGEHQELVAVVFEMLRLPGSFLAR